MGAKELVVSLPRVFSGALKDKGEALAKASSDIVSVFGNNAALKQAVGVGPKATDIEIRKKIFDELSAEGTTPFKRWLSEEIATKSGSTGTADQLESLFALGSKARSEARAFGPQAQSAAARSLTESLERMQGNVKQVRGEAFKEGMETAAEQFKTLPLKKIKESLKILRNESEAFIPDEGEVSLLSEADQKKIMDAMRIIYQGDIKGIQKVFPKIQAGDNPTTEQLFWRLQAARQMIDKWGKKLNREGFNEQAVAMDGFRSKIDDMLKLSDEKRATDVMYREGQKATSPMFKSIETKLDGQRFIDTTKVQGTFQGTRKGEQFIDRMDQLQTFLHESGLPFDHNIRSDVFNQFKNVTTTAANRRLVESMKRQGGPSAQAIEALAGQKAKNIVQEIIIRPSAVLQKIDEEISRRGGTFSEKELADLSKWRSMFEKLAENSGRGVLPSDAWSLGLSFAASKIGVDFIKKYIQTQGE
jgi:predicted transcriptional regulator